MRDIDKYQDILDVRDIIARIEELESEIEDDESGELEDERDELKTLAALLDEMKGYGGDEQWRGDWYPGYLIRDSHFESYAEELAEDIGAIDRNARWPLNHIHWARAADELKMDYSAADFDGVTYWYR